MPCTDCKTSKSKLVARDLKLKVAQLQKELAELKAKIKGSATDSDPDLTFLD
jgi:hypothetical protein